MAIIHVIGFIQKLELELCQTDRKEQGNPIHLSFDSCIKFSRKRRNSSEIKTVDKNLYVDQRCCLNEPIHQKRPNQEGHVNPLYENHISHLKILPIRSSPAS